MLPIRSVYRLQLWIKKLIRFEVSLSLSKAGGSPAVIVQVAFAINRDTSKKMSPADYLIPTAHRLRFFAAPYFLNNKSVFYLCQVCISCARWSSG
jgi:hypothetical protein